jgi:hypothetical protein
VSASSAPSNDGNDDENATATTETRPQVAAAMAALLHTAFEGVGGGGCIPEWGR